MDAVEKAIKSKYGLLKSSLDEKARRRVLAAEAMSLGFGGVSKVSRATGVSRITISNGCRELLAGAVEGDGRIRKPGGGRKKATGKDSTLLKDLESLVEPTARGNPESPLRWTHKSLRRLSVELEKMGHSLSHTRVGEQLKKMGYSLQSNKKSKEGASHPDRDAQFERINQKTRGFMQQEQPVISVDTKKKELVGDFKNNGRNWSPKGNPEKVRVHDFEIQNLGKVNPYGVYDVKKNLGWVNVGVDNDTAAFAVESIKHWWRTMGKPKYPNAKKILITADCGGSNGYRNRLWKVELQKLADKTGLNLSVCHFPPGTSKWNKIEHKLFSFISKNWRGKPLISHAVIINLIAATTTAKGLTVKCRLDKKKYPKGVKVSDEQIAQVNIQQDKFHGEWNYTIRPKKQ